MMLSFDGPETRIRAMLDFPCRSRFLCWRTFSDFQFDDYHADVRLVPYRENTCFARIILRSHKPDLFI